MTITIKVLELWGEAEYHFESPNTLLHSFLHTNWTRIPIVQTLEGYNVDLNTSVGEIGDHVVLVVHRFGPVEKNCK